MKIEKIGTPEVIKESWKFISSSFIVTLKIFGVVMAGLFLLLAAVSLLDFVSKIHPFLTAFLMIFYLVVLLKILIICTDRI